MIMINIIWQKSKKKKADKATPPLQKIKIKYRSGYINYVMLTSFYLMLYFHILSLSFVNMQTGDKCQWKWKFWVIISKFQDF